MGCKLQYFLTLRLLFEETMNHTPSVPNCSTFWLIRAILHAKLMYQHEFFPKIFTPIKDHIEKKNWREFFSRKTNRKYIIFRVQNGRLPKRLSNLGRREYKFCHFKFISQRCSPNQGDSCIQTVPSPDSTGVLCVRQLTAGV